MCLIERPLNRMPLGVRFFYVKTFCYIANNIKIEQLYSFSKY